MSILAIRSKRRLSCACLVLLAGFSLFSARTSSAQSALALFGPMTATSTIERFSTISNGSVYVRLEGVPVINPRGCGSNYWYVLVKGNNPEGMSRMLATLLTARASDLRVRLGISATECVNNSPKVVSVMIEPS